MANVSPELPADWRVASQLLQAGEYQQANDLLQTIQSSAPADNPLLALLVGAVQQICLACWQCQADVEWHQQASAAASEREQQLRQQGQALLARFVGLPVTTELSTPVDLPIAAPAVAPSATQGGLRQRLHTLLSHGKRLVIPERNPPHLAALAADATPAATEPTFSVAATAYPVETMDEVTNEPEPPPALAIYCLGPFQVYQDDQPVEDWISGKGQAIFKYLIAHRERPVAKELLMDLFWPEATPEAARNNLNVAISGLRRALRQHQPAGSHIIFQNDAYLINPALTLWVDVEEFSQHYRAGQRHESAGELAAAMAEYRTAEALCQGEFLAEDRYEDWPRAQRQHLQDEYLDLLDRLSRYYLAEKQYDTCLMMCSKVLALDLCHEEAHRRLMRCYARQGHHHLALRQYHLCVDALKRELDVEPDQATQELYAQIRRRRPV